MFFVLSKTVGLLLNPVTLLVLVLIAYLITNRKSGWKKGLGLSFIFLFLLFSNPYIGNQLLIWWEVPGTPYQQLDQKFSTAIVLGGITASQQAPYDRVHIKSGADRVLHALDLYKKGYVKKILLSGGSGRLAGDSVSEAQRMYKVLTLAGVPKRALLVEESSRNTFENAKNSQSVLLNNNLNPPYILITSAYHMRRAQACFNANEVEVQPFSTDFMASQPPFTIDQYIIPNSGAFRAWEILFKEWAGLASYWLRGYV